MRFAATTVVLTVLATTAAGVSPGQSSVGEIASQKARTSVTMTASASTARVGDAITLSATVKPKRRAKLTFQKSLGRGWTAIATRTTTKQGRARTVWVTPAAGNYRLRAKVGKATSKATNVLVTPTPTPSTPAPEPSTGTPTTPSPPPDPQPTSATAIWPTNTGLVIDTSYPVTVNVSPALKAAVSIQQKTGATWTDMPGGSGTTETDGTAVLTLSQPVGGTGSFRVAVAGTNVATSGQQLSFSAAGDALYNVPLRLPSTPGVMVKAQEFPMTYPKYPIQNPLKPSESLIIPQIGDPAAGPPACVTDASVPRADCKIPGRQYRVMYTDKRWVPDTGGGGQVATGTEAATALVMVPNNVAADAPVVAWAHPTVGQADRCSISRGITDISTGPGGMDINLLDVSFFLNQMLARGYVVVMPDYLGNAVNGPTSRQKTFLVGPQEARDLFYAVAALRTPANPALGWPGVTSGKRFVAVGHSQGGHAALWAGIEASQLEPETGLQLKGVIAASPAADLNQIVSAQWDSQVGWMLGPDIIQTFAGYLPEFVSTNDVVSQAGQENLEEFQDYCTTQALEASERYFPNGRHNPGTPFLRDPSDPANQQAYANWGHLLAAMTPTIAQGQPNSFPKTLPLSLISGTADDVVVSQVTAAMQESFCAAGANLRTFWTPVTTGAVNSADATEPGQLQAADHLLVLNYPLANDVKTGASTQVQIAAGAVLAFTEARFAGQTQTPNCAQRQTTHASPTPLGSVQSWYAFPTVDWAKLSIDPTQASFYDGGGSPLLPYPTTANPPPALGTIDTSNLSQTGCGFPFRLKGIFFESNPACVQWGLWPYGTFVYPDAKAGSTWGTYPADRPR